MGILGGTMIPRAKTRQTRAKTIRNSITACIVAGTALLLLSCDDSKTSTKNPTKLPMSILALQQPENCDSLKSYVSRSILKRNTTIYRHLSYCYDMIANPMIGAPEASPVTGGTAGGTLADRAPDGVSDTNNQEVGVNESDIVKADANGFMYMLTGRHLVVAKGFPPTELSTLKEVDLGLHGTHLFLDKANQRAIVLGMNDQPFYIGTPSPSDGIAIRQPMVPDETAILFFDVSTPENPTLIEHINVAAYLQTGRRIDERLHLVLREYISPQALYNDPGFWTLRQAFWDNVRQLQCSDPNLTVAEIEANEKVVQAKMDLAAHIDTLVADMSDAELVPKATRVSAAGITEEIPFLSCPDIQHPGVESNLGLQIVASVNTDGSNLGATAIVNSSWQAYASSDHLYLAASSRNWWWPMEGNDTKSQTAIYKFRISPDQKPQFSAMGTVPGVTLNQFSFSEHNGYLRVATTEDDWIQQDGVWQRVQQNDVFVLSQANTGTAGTMTIHGELRGLAPGETIHSSRFIGDKGYIVTFRNIDPLFSLDLSDPANPQKRGELHIPGVSTYIHPYDENHLITAGRGQEGTRLTGMQLQLFDVSDMDNPALLHRYTPGSNTNWVWSEAQYNHLAFNFYKPRDLLAIPVSYSDSQLVFNGIMAFNVSPQNGFTLLGQVDHADLVREYYCGPDVNLLPGYSIYCNDNRYYYWGPARRSVIMTSGAETFLYSISDVGVKASEVSELSTVLGRILFPLQAYHFIIWVMWADLPVFQLMVRLVGSCQ